MSKTFSAVFAIFSLFFSLFSHAEQQLKHELTLTSEQLNEEMQVLVQLPPGYHDSSPQDKTPPVYPVLYVLEGADSLVMIDGMMQRMGLSAAVPAAIIVAVGTNDRLRDLTPTVNRDPRGPVGMGGGADKYLAYLESELIPYMDKNYRTHDFKIVTGASIGGLFVLHTMQARPQLFDAHFAFSPAVWWGDQTTRKRVQSFFIKNATFDSFLYMNIGRESGAVRDVYDQFHDFMSANNTKGFTFHSDSFPRVPHGLTSTAGMFNALHSLFLPLNMPLSELTKGTEPLASKIESYYAKLSGQRGKSMAPNEAQLRTLGYQLADTGDLDKANALFRYNIGLNLQSPEAYNGLAFGLEQAGKYAESLEQVEKAIALSKPEDASYQVFIGRRDRLQKQLSE